MPSLRHIACSLAVVAALLAIGVGTLSAQQRVVGQVVDLGTGTPIGTAFLILLDEAGTRTGGTLSNSEGHFVLEAPRPGRYRVVVERIGYLTTTSEPLQLAAGQALAYRLAVASRAVELQGITATGERRCVLRPHDGLHLHRLWEEVRKALSVAVWTESQPGFHYEAIGFSRVRDRRTLEIEADTQSLQRGFTVDPFDTSPAAALAKNGYIQRTDEGFQYYGIDAKHLLSDAFLDNHCFRVQPPSRHEPGLIGLAFQPVRTQNLPDVRGVLWLDARTAELRYLEYEYTRHLHPMPIPVRPFGGRTEFRQLENGYWITERWWIRMPEFHVAVVAPGERERTRLMVREVGAEVIEVLARAPEADEAGKPADTGTSPAPHP